MNKKEHLYYLDVLKIFACLCVIMNHAIELMKNYANNSFRGALFYSVNYGIYKTAVPIFIMITGVLLLKRKNTYKDVFKRIWRVFVPLFLLSLLLYIKGNTFTNFSFSLFLQHFLKDPIVQPYWYLYMLISLYLMTPFIQKMVKNFETKDVIYFLIFILIIPSILQVITTYSQIQFSNSFKMAWISIYIGYFVMGYYLNQVELKKNFFKIAIVIYVISSFCLGLSMFLPFHQGQGLSLF